MSDINNNEENQSSEKEKKGQTSLISRLIHGATDGAANVAKNAKKGFSLGKTAFKQGVKTVMAKPAVLALATTTGVVGTYGGFVAYDSYKKDNLITMKTDTWECTPGTVDVVTGDGSGDNDIQANVDVMYDLFVNELGYSDNFVVGLVACMMCESNVDPDRLESDYILKSEKEAFDGAVGKGTGAKGQTVLDAYHDYGTAYQSGGGWNGNSFYFDDDGGMACGIGLIQWTGGRGKALCMGTEVIDQDYSVVDLPYQLAFLVAEINGMDGATGYPDLKADQFSAGSDTEAIEIVFKKLINGSAAAASTQLPDRLANEGEARGYVSSAAANSEYTADMMSMIDALGESASVGSFKNAIGINLCGNGDQLDTSAIAKAAVSVAWLEFGEYNKEDKAVVKQPIDPKTGAAADNVYTKARRTVFAPNIINDWNLIEGKNHQKSLGDIFTGEGVEEGTWDCVACTEFYYYAHRIVLPEEDATAKPGYFSSCDRSACVPVRMAGADDLFPAGNPDWQLKYSIGKARAGTDVMLWDPAGFLRGADLYSYNGSTSIAPGTLLITWDINAANGKLSGTEGAATGSGDGDDDEGEDEGEVEEDETDAAKKRLKEAKTRLAISKAESRNHIIVYVGRGTVTGEWDPDFLLEQYHAYPDCENLVRGDLNVKGAKEMNTGKSVKASSAKQGTEFRITFYDVDPVQTNQYPFWDAKTATSSKVYDNGKGPYSRFTDQTSETAAEFITSWNKKKQEERAVAEDKVTKREKDTVYNPRTGLLEFRAWSEIMWALLHNDDNEIWYKEAKETGFYNDWKDVDQGGEGNYKVEDWRATKDNTNRSIAGIPDSDTPDDIAWRYSLITDYEYRAQQFQRFAIAAAMCNTATEEDADIYQYDKKNPRKGAILGNVYRYIADQWKDGTDNYKSYVIPKDYNRFLYYDTVVSNDMLQDLMQLYTYGMNYADADLCEEANKDTIKKINGGGEPETDDTGVSDDGAKLNHRATMGARYNKGVFEECDITGRQDNIDRRYALTKKDINFIKSQSKFKLGMSSGSAWSLLRSYVTTPLYNKNGTNTIANPGEGEGPYVIGGQAQALYSLNPFVPSAGNESEAYMINPLNRGIDADDQWMNIYNDDAAKYFWITDHYYYNDLSKSVNMIAYMVLDFNKDGMVDYSEFHRYDKDEYKNQLSKYEHKPLQNAEDTDIKKHDDYNREYEMVRYPGDYNFIDNDLWQKIEEDGIYGHAYYNEKGKDITWEGLLLYNYEHPLRGHHDPDPPDDPEEYDYCLECLKKEEDCGHSLDPLVIDCDYDDLSELGGKIEESAASWPDNFELVSVEVENGEKDPADASGQSRNHGEGKHGTKVTITYIVKCTGIPVTKIYDFGKVENPNDPNCLSEGGNEDKYDDELTIDEEVNQDDQIGKKNPNNRRWLKEKGKDVFVRLQLVKYPRESFDVKDYMDGTKIKYFQNDVLIQIPYDGNGWIKDTAWEVFEEFEVKGYGEKCGCHDDKFFHSKTSCRDYGMAHTPETTPGQTRGQKTIPSGSKYEPYYKAFSVEGDCICASPESSDLTNGRSRYYSGKKNMLYKLFANTDKRCTCGGLYMVQSIRNKVAIGKEATESWDTTYSKDSVGSYISCKGCTEVSAVNFTQKHGEEDVVGKQHDKNILEAKCCDKLEFNPEKSSLLRNILGLDHVFHVKMIGQDIDEVYEDYFTHELTPDEHPKKNQIGINLENYSDPSAATNKGEYEKTFDNELLSEGDDSHWVVHGSRGNRGPKCQYLNFTFFGIADSELSSNDNSLSWTAPSYLKDPEKEPSASNIDFAKKVKNPAGGTNADSKSKRIDQGYTSTETLAKSNVTNYQYMLIVNTPAEDRTHGGRTWYTTALGSLSGDHKQKLRLKVEDGEHLAEKWSTAWEKFKGKEGVKKLYTKPSYTYGGVSGTTKDSYKVGGKTYFYGSGNASRWKQLIDNFNYRERNSWDKATN